jgi:hypothetical protein
MINNNNTEAFITTESTRSGQPANHNHGPSGCGGGRGRPGWVRRSNPATAMMTPPAVLSPADLHHFTEHGWVVAKSVIDPAQARRTAEEVWAFAGLDPDDEECWYEDDGTTLRRINTAMYHGQSQWDNRTAPRVHGAFSQVWGTPRLWTSHDSVNINPPSRAAPPPPPKDLHWDCDLRLWTLDQAKAARPIQGGIQGVLYLVDTPPQNGAFVCVPGFHRKLDAWLDELPPDTDNLREAFNRQFPAGGPDALRVGAAAGDLIIWDTRLPHTGSVNCGTKPRVCQYISMFPAPVDMDTARPHTLGHQRDGVSATDMPHGEYRRRWYEECTGGLKSLGGADSHGGQPAAPSNRSGPAALRSILARRLAGLEPWPAEVAPVVPAYEHALGLPPWESENLAPIITSAGPTAARM